MFIYATFRNIWYLRYYYIRQKKKKKKIENE